MPECSMAQRKVSAKSRSETSFHVRPLSTHPRPPWANAGPSSPYRRLFARRVQVEPHPTPNGSPTAQSHKPVMKLRVLGKRGGVDIVPSSSWSARLFRFRSRGRRA